MSRLLHTKATRSGFTIIETLVAITILMIAVAGPLVAASRSLNAALYSRDQMVASFLAQETMEVIKSKRGNQIVNGVDDWVTTLGYDKCVGSDKRCDMSFVDNFQVSCLKPSCVVTVGITGDYSHFSGFLSSLGGLKFYRYFYFEQKNNPSVSEVVAHVVVEWNQGAIPYQIELVSTLLSTNR